MLQHTEELQYIDINSVPERNFMTHVLSPLLILNPGSSTLKFAVYGEDETPLAEGTVDRLGKPEARLKWERAGKAQSTESLPDATPTSALEAVLGKVAKGVAALGCRVVMGGERFVETTPVTPEVIKEVRRLGELAPLHNPVAADTLETVRRLLPGTPLFAVFDTAFHATLPEVARTYALPYALTEKEHLRRYGFHGIAHRWVSARLREQLEAAGHPSGCCVTCHLGSGASVCAVHDGKSVDTSMGLTPTEGLVMGTRSGDVDPGLLIHLLRQGKSPDDLEGLLNKESGLLGLSGVSADLRDVEAAAKSGNARAELAMEVFAYRVSKTIGAYAVGLEGLNAVAFSGGIGENSATMRQRICRRLAFLGLHLDTERNTTGMGEEAAPTNLSTANASVQTWIIPADETQQMVQEIRQSQTKEATQKNS